MKASRTAPALLLFALAALAPPADAVTPEVTKAPKTMSKAPEFVPIDYAAVPGWTTDDHAAAVRAFAKSCSRVVDLAAACAEAHALMKGRMDAAVARGFFEKNFKPHRVTHAQPQGLVTGYYEPVLNGSRQKTTVFKEPLYQRPPDLVNLVDDAMRGAVGAKLTHARRTETGTAPYPTRAEIEQGALAGKGLELVYLSDVVDVFFLHVQGSGRITLPDGSSMRVAYNGKNGHPYTSIGRYMVEQGLILRDHATMQGLGAWLRANPAKGREVMWQNASYIFFRELPGTAPGPIGVSDIPLTPGRSLAVDAGVHSIGRPVWVNAPSLANVTGKGPFQRLMIAQDVGSAIKGPERGDIFFGSGNAAGERAGTTRHPANFFVLLPRTAQAASAASGPALP